LVQQTLKLLKHRNAVPSAACKPFGLGGTGTGSAFVYLSFRGAVKLAQDLPGCGIDRGYCARGDLDIRGHLSRFYAPVVPTPMIPVTAFIA
jgi:hypothetical protein